MAVSYKFMPQYSAVIARASGLLTREDIIGFLSSLAIDTKIPLNHITLFDASRINDFVLAPDDIEEIVSFVKAGGQKIVAKKLAIITRGRKETELAEKYEKLAAAFQEGTIVFYHHDLACKWLGIPEEVIKES